MRGGRKRRAPRGQIVACKGKEAPWRVGTFWVYFTKAFRARCKSEVDRGWRTSLLMTTLAVYRIWRTARTHSRLNRLHCTAG